jgi:hypothetical protein
MFILIVIAAVGCAVGLRSTPVTWMFGGVLVGAICIATATAGWSWAAVLQSLACLIAFNGIALGVSALRLNRLSQSPVSTKRNTDAGLKPASKTAS